VFAFDALEHVVALLRLQRSIGPRRQSSRLCRIERLYLPVRQSDGALLKTNNLPDRGQDEIRISISLDGTALYVGTNGYELSLSTAEFFLTKWQVSLPGCGFTIVSVLAGLNERILFGSNGYVYELSSDQGAILATNTLPGQGQHEIQLSAAPSNIVLAVGMNGYGFGLRLPGYPSFEGAWMSQLSATIGSKKLSQVALPGTDDSGTYAITPFSPVGKDFPWYVIIS